jgi:uncharacterized glyoxalase superfamily protein PhnB
MKGSHRILYGSNNVELNFETEELDDMYNELKQLKVEFIHEIQEAPWGQRGITLYDPNYFSLKNSSYASGVDAIVLQALV